MTKTIALSGPAIPAILRLLADKAPGMTLAEVLGDPSIGPHARAMTLRQFRDALGASGAAPRAAAPRAEAPRAAAPQAEAAAASGGGGKRGPGAPRGDRMAHARNVREYDAAVLLEIMNAAAPIGAEAVRAKVGGNAAAFRASAERLIAAKKVKKGGIAKGTRYRPA